MKNLVALVICLAFLAVNVQTTKADGATVITRAGPDEWVICEFGDCEHLDGVLSQTYIYSPEGYHWRGVYRGTYEVYDESSGKVLFEQEFHNINVGAIQLPNNSVYIYQNQFVNTSGGTTCAYDIRYHFTNGEYQFNEMEVVCEP